MGKQSAGILLFKTEGGLPEFFLVHPGGPFWQKKDQGAWSIPKGEFTEQEDALSAARREFEEETGIFLIGNFIELAPVKQKAGKTIYAWAVEGDADPAKISSNLFSIEWPPGSGKSKQFPEVDKAAWYTADEAMQKINPAQKALITDLINKIQVDDRKV